MTESVLPQYDKALAEAGALVCLDNGDGPLRYVGQTTDQTGCCCFLWVGGCHKGLYAIYNPSNLRMAPQSFRKDGWYWVRMLGWGDKYGDWVPAEWRQASKSWYSTLFSGIPDSEMIVGAALASPSK
jgi:hypothetical protein